MRFADIACGSGSFLLGVYDCLLRYHRDWYNNNPSKAKSGECKIDEDDVLHLTLQKKREILVNNVFGVDVDPQAVEVAQLSLYLKLLEEETTATARYYQLELHETILPSLSKNIVCGNSLISSDIIDSEGLSLDEQKHINPMDFTDVFPEIMRGGGFHAIVGNPPYVNAWEFFDSQPQIRDYLNKRTAYATADRHWDLYVLFIERALQLIRKSGRFSYIIPYSYAIQKYGLSSRKLLLEKCTIESVADIRGVQVFRDVPVITMIPVVINSEPSSKHEIEIRHPSQDSTKKSIGSFAYGHHIQQRAYLKQHEFMLRIDWSTDALSFVKKLGENSIPLGDICYVNYGAQMSSREKGLFGKEYVIRDFQENKNCRPMIGGKELYRYDIRWTGRYVDWTFADQMYGPRWPEFFELPKLMIRDITGTHRIESTLDKNGFYCDHTILCALRKCDVAEWKNFTADDITRSEQYDLRFLAAVVGSTAISAYFYLVLSGEGVRSGGGFHTYPQTIKAFPIPILNEDNLDQMRRAHRATELVEQLLEAKEHRSEAKTTRDIDFFDKRISSLDRQIDELVNQMFGLDATDIAVALKAAGMATLN